MSLSPFEAFCEELCELLHQPVPRLHPDPNGQLAFTVVADGVPVSFYQGRPHEGAEVLMLVDFGDYPREREGDFLRNLMEANAVMRGPGSPAYGVHPSTGTIVLRATYTEHEMNAQRAAATLVAAVRAVQAWMPSTTESEVNDRPGDERPMWPSMAC